MSKQRKLHVEAAKVRALICPKEALLSRKELLAPIEFYCAFPTMLQMLWEIGQVSKDRDTGIGKQ